MSKKTLSLIIFLALMTAFLLWLALQMDHPLRHFRVQISPSPITTADTTLSFFPLPLTNSLGEHMVNIVIDPHSNTVISTQLEIAYDSHILQHIMIKPGGFFSDPVEVIKNIDSTNGRISYVLKGSGKNPPSKNKGILATIWYSYVLSGTSSATQLLFLPKTQVTAYGISSSALQSTGSAIIIPLH